MRAPVGAARRRLHPWPAIARATPLLLAALASARPLLAQSVRGRMLEAASGAPVPGALVELRTSADSVVGAVLTDEGGRFALEAPAAGTYRLHAERIGYADWDSRPFDLAAGESASRTIRVPAHPVSLSELSVTAERQCRLARNQGEATARVWAEVRKALRFTLLSEREERDEYVKRHFTRKLDDQASRVLQEQAWSDTTLRSVPYVSESAERLAREGFVTGTIQKGRLFAAPGVETLLSDPFLETHCIEVQGERKVEGEEWVGLDFEPLEGRTLPDVAGTLWLAANGSELREMDFHYVNVEVPNAGVHRKDEGIPGGLLPIRAPGVGGQVTFTRLPSGRWIVRDWELTLPIIGQRRRSWRSDERQEYVLAGMVQHGGEVLQVKSPDGRVLFRRDRATLGGVVVDSTRAARMAGAVVTLEGTGRVDTTNADGRFSFADLDGGRLTLRVEDPRLDTLGLDSLSGAVTLREGSVTEAVFGVPSWRTLLASGCAAGDAGDSSGIVVGVVRDADSGRPLPGARVAVLAADSSSGGAGASATPPRTTGATGTFAFCGLPGPSRVRMAVRAPGRPPVEAMVRVMPADTFLWTVDVPASAGTGIAGRVLDRDTDRPVAMAGVRVGMLPATGEALYSTAADSAGRFALSDLPPGDYAVRIEAPGYAAAADTLRVRESSSLRLDVHLGTQVTALAPIHVEVVGSRPERAASAFSQKANHIYGMNQEQIQKLLPQAPAMKDLIRRMNAPGFEVTYEQLSPGQISDVGTLPCVRSNRDGVSYRRQGPALQDCARVYLNDTQLNPREGAQLLETMSPEQVCKVEVIPASEAGARFGTGSTNGVVLIYTRPCR